jgi:hypothetical protein
MHREIVLRRSTRHQLRRDDEAIVMRMQRAKILALCELGHGRAEGVIYITSRELFALPSQIC